MRGWPIAFLALAGTVTAQDPISLQELQQIARQRFEAERPKQLAALEPFLEDLAMDYGQSAEYLDRRFAMVAELGDGMVPALLEKLTPEEEGDRAHRNAAENSARVLLLIDPSGFTDALIELCKSPSYTARRHAIWLLGHTDSRDAANAMIGMLDTPNASQRVQLVQALQKLGSIEAAPQIAAFLASENQTLKVTALRYLAATKPPAALEPVLASLATEKAPELLPFYVSYLDGAAPRNARAANALTRLIEPHHTDRDQMLAIVRTLARVAPEKHEPTITACKAILDLGDTADLGLACALTMRDLGDREGIKQLLDRLRQEIRRDRKNDVPLVSSGHAYRALEQWDDAARHYEAAAERTKNRSLKRGLFLLVARCEAHQQRWTQVLKALKESGASYAAIIVTASEDPALQKALEHPSIAKYVERLPRAGSNGN